MKKKIHPHWYDNCQVSCACGNQFVTGSTMEKIQVEICSRCHPFFTGEMKFVDTMGRVEKFQQKTALASRKKYIKKSLRRKLKEKKELKKIQSQPKTLKEMLQKQLKEEKDKEKLSLNKK